MDYSALIQSRKSVRAFRDTAISDNALNEIEDFYRTACHRLYPEIQTELVVCGNNLHVALEGIAGYEGFMIGARGYIVLLSEDVPYATENAGYIAEDILLKLEDMNFNSCWLTFDDGEAIKKKLNLDGNMVVLALLAFGYGAKERKTFRLTVHNISNVDIEAKRRYYSPKKSLYDMVFVEKWGCTDGVDEYLGYFDDFLWRAFYAASLAPSYLNRQPYAFILRNNEVILIQTPDKYTDDTSTKIGHGIVMLHFAAVIEQLGHVAKWKFGVDNADLDLPDGFIAVASYHL